jgi:hypothetical protein
MTEPIIEAEGLVKRFGKVDGLHGSIGAALLAFGLCVVCGFAFLWMFVVALQQRKA